MERRLVVCVREILAAIWTVRASKRTFVVLLCLPFMKYKWMLSNWGKLSCLSEAKNEKKTHAKELWKDNQRKLDMNENTYNSFLQVSRSFSLYNRFVKFQRNAFMGLYQKTSTPQQQQHKNDKIHSKNEATQVNKRNKQAKSLKTKRFIVWHIDTNPKQAQFFISLGGIVHM